MLDNEIVFRKAEPSDYQSIISVQPAWWGGRDLTYLLPELFLDHFCDTSFVVEHNAELVGFLVGFMSPARPKEAYIHFVGVHPDFRKAGLGKALYEKFFELCRKQGRTIVRAITSPVNTGSVAYHLRMGFQVEQGGKKVHFTKYLDA